MMSLDACFGWAIFGAMLLVAGAVTTLPGLYVYYRLAGNRSCPWRVRLLAIALGCGAVWFGLPWLVGMFFGSDLG